LQLVAEKSAQVIPPSAPRQLDGAMQSSPDAALHGEPSETGDEQRLWKHTPPPPQTVVADPQASPGCATVYAVHMLVVVSQ
jgi:hypothetical protein